MSTLLLLTDVPGLGKQRIEAYQILQTLLVESDGWRNHPAVRMWHGYEYTLLCYGTIICCEWVARGYRDSMLEKFARLTTQCYTQYPVMRPQWLTRDFCLAHQSNLIRKLPTHYRPIFGDSVPNDLPYIWPVDSTALNNS